MGKDAVKKAKAAPKSRAVSAGRTLRFTKAKVLAAIEGSGGIMSAIASRLGCDWHTAYKYVGMYEETLAAVSAEAERLLDSAESAMHNLISQGDGAMIRYFLSTKGRGRGYSSETKIDVTSNGKDLLGRIEIVDKTDLVK